MVSFPRHCKTVHRGGACRLREESPYFNGEYVNCSRPLPGSKHTKKISAPHPTYGAVQPSILTIGLYRRLLSLTFPAPAIADPLYF